MFPKECKLLRALLSIVASAVLMANCTDNAMPDDRKNPGGNFSVKAEETPKVETPAPQPEPDVPPPLRDSLCQTKYPILLVHGIALRDSILGQNYFGRVPAYLKSHCKVEVFQGGQDAFSISAINAVQLRKVILHITDDLGYEKVNVIAHSKGGIDMRFMFYQSKDESIDGRSMKERVATFTTISTPHRGSALADYLLPRFNEESKQLIASALDIFGFLQGDTAQSEAYNSLSMLSSETMQKWNKDFGDLEKGIEGVYCQSWSADINGLIQDSVLKATSSIIDNLGLSRNDGAVQEASAIYARYRGVIGDGVLGGVSHFAVVDRAAGLTPGVTPGFNALAFYAEILTELSVLGY